MFNVEELTILKFLKKKTLEDTINSIKESLPRYNPTENEIELEFLNYLLEKLMKLSEEDFKKINFDDLPNFD